MPGRKDLESRAAQALAAFAACGALIAAGGPGPELNPPAKAALQECEDPALIFHYTESPCRQDPFCDDPSRPDADFATALWLDRVGPDGPVYAHWWCKIINNVRHVCLWPASRGMFLTYASYYETWHERRGEYTPCDGFVDECMIPYGWARKLTP